METSLTQHGIHPELGWLTWQFKYDSLRNCGDSGQWPFAARQEENRWLSAGLHPARFVFLVSLWVLSAKRDCHWWWMVYLNVLDTSWYILILLDVDFKRWDSIILVNKYLFVPLFAFNQFEFVAASCSLCCSTALDLPKACQPLRRKSLATSRGSCRFQGRIA